MGVLRRLFGGSPVLDAMRLEILMEYAPTLGSGTAALRWTDPLSGGQPTGAQLVALLYGRILCVHAETRSELFDRVNDLATANVRTEGIAGFEFASWVLCPGLGAPEQTLWPWRIAQPGELADSRVYVATLKSGRATPRAPLGRWIHLKMAFGLERILAPSSALIAIAGFSRECDRETRYMLSLLLWQMNVYWGSPAKVTIGSEALAYSAADSAIRSGQLRTP